MSEKRVHWQPIGALPMIASMVDDWLDEVEEQYANLDVCRSKPYVLDEQTVGRIIKLYSAQAADIWIFEEQFSRWRSLNLTPQRCQKVDCMTAQILAISERITAILALAEVLKRGTIESVLAKSDLELGLEGLLGNSML